MSFPGKKDTGIIAADAFKRGYYTHVSNITADNLEGVFHVGNMGPEENIERFLPMHSVSVGDIVEDQLGHKSVVASFGFKESNSYLLLVMTSTYFTKEKSEDCFDSIFAKSR